MWNGVGDRWQDETHLMCQEETDGNSRPSVSWSGLPRRWGRHLQRRAWDNAQPARALARLLADLLESVFAAIRATRAWVFLHEEGHLCILFASFLFGSGECAEAKS